MNILECTIKMKQETQTHYERLAEAVTDVEVKRLFTLLAAAEEEYIGKIALLAGNVGKAGVKEYNKLGEGVCVYSPHIDPLHLADTLKNDPDAYSHVVQEEQGVIEFLDNLSDQAENEEMKKICHLLADKEREQLATVENFYSYIEEPRTYLEWGEFSNLKTL